MNPEFLAGVAVRDMTPDPQSVDNTLHCTMTVRLDERGSPLKAKALALSFEGRTQLLVGLDLVYMLTPTAWTVRGAIAEATGIKLEDIVLSCSHSHSTPMIEPLQGPHPFLDLVIRQSVSAAAEAAASLRPARFGYGVTHAVGASFNTRVPLADGRVKFTRDFREGLASGRPIDPRLSVVRIDDADGRPIAGWLRFAAHPATVIFNAPVSADYPGYLTERLEEMIDRRPPILFGYGGSGDVNIAPMFGQEEDARNTGHQLARIVAPAFESIRTQAPRRVLRGNAEVRLPLDEPPSVETLDRQISEVEDFIAAVQRDPDLVWAMDFNCNPDWPAKKKQDAVRPLGEWARLVKERLSAGQPLPTTWTRQVTAWVIDDLGLVFDEGETLTELSLALSSRSPLKETLLLSLCNGGDAYLGTDLDRLRGGYETHLSTRFALLADDSRPLPYALGAADRYLEQILDLLNGLAASDTRTGGRC